eukprot:5658371-Pyramimonas_sp.AAC.1
MGWVRHRVISLLHFRRLVATSAKRNKITPFYSARRNDANEHMLLHFPLYVEASHGTGGSANNNIIPLRSPRSNDI